MDIYYLAFVFLSIIIMLFVFKKPLLLSILVGIVLAIILYQIPLVTSFEIFVDSITSKNTITVLLILYLITLLQRMMEKEGSLNSAQQSIEKIFTNRRLNTFISPMFMGLLPSASAIYMAGAMVNESVGDDLSKEDKTFIASYYRHTFESFLPTYSSVIIAVSLANVSLNNFIVGMVPMVIVFILLGYFFYLRKLDSHSVIKKHSKKEALFSLLYSLAPIIIILVLILVFNIEVQYAALLVIVVYTIYKKYNVNEMIGFIKSAFEIKVLTTMALVFIFKDIINYTKVIELLPSLFENLAIPAFLIYGIIFFIASLILGNSAANVIVIPLAFATIPNAGMPLLVYLNSIGFIAMQISPTHLCLYLACEYFKIDLASLIKKTAPIVAVFLVIINIYYLILNHFI